MPRVDDYSISELSPDYMCTHICYSVFGKAVESAVMAPTQSLAEYCSRQPKMQTHLEMFTVNTAHVDSRETSD